MAQIFRRAMNPFSKASIFGGVFIIAALIYVFDLLYTSPYVNEVNVIREQPVPFSHRHHVKELGIDCRFCHVSAETSSFAGIPSVQTCMTCHSQVWTQAEVLEPLRKAARTGQPLPWVRVNSVPDYVYFDHSIHVQKGVACITCHGPVGDMPLTWRQSTLQMKWCLSCHRDPAKFIQPRDTIFQTQYTRSDSQEKYDALLVHYQIKKLTDCYTCHR